VSFQRKERWDADGCYKVPSTWGPVVQEGVSAKELSVVPFDVDINYDYWGYREFSRASESMG
jgi:hypothetical protein